MNETKPIDGPDQMDEDETVLVELGDRVRAARTAKGLPRRVLSDRSGVSPRYLAQLESGQGNISVRLLNRVARALGQPMDVLLGAPAGDAAHIAKAYVDADTSVQTRVAEMLNLSHLADDRAHRLCLIGLRGAGKTTLGKAIARAFRVPFVELNTEIERQGAMPVSEIMGLYGPDGYREIEGRALVDVAEQYDRVVLAVGGGLVSEPETYRFLRQRFHTLWVKAAPEDHMARVQAQGDMRPMQGNPRAMAQLQDLLRTREAAYAQADATLDTHQQSKDRSELDAVSMVRRAGFLGDM